MTYIHKRVKKWTTQISWYAIYNKRKYKTNGGFPTKKQAQEWTNKLEVTKSDNLISAKDSVFAEYYKDRCNTYKKPGKTGTTKERYDVLSFEYTVKELI